MTISSRILLIFLLIAPASISGAQNEARATENSQTNRRQVSQKSTDLTPPLMAEAFAALDKGDTATAQRLLQTVIANIVS